MTELHSQASEEATARELLRCVGASVSDLRVERIVEYGRERTRQALERALGAIEALKGAAGDKGPLFVAYGVRLYPMALNDAKEAIRGLSDGESVASEER